MTSITATARSRSAPSTAWGRPVLALARRELLTTRSYRLAFVLDLVFGVLGLAVYFFISRTFDDPAPGELGAAPSYFAYAAVGIALGLVIDAATDGIASTVRGEQLTGTLEALVAQPVTPLELCLGLASFPLAFAVIRAAAYALVAGVWASADLSQASWPGLAVMLATSGLALFSLGILAGAAVLVVKRGDDLVSVAVFGMTLVSGAVFPPSVLPGWLETIGRAIPLRFAFDGTRAALFTGAGWQDDALALLAVAAVGLPLAVAVFAWALRFSKARGTLAGY